MHYTYIWKGKKNSTILNLHNNLNLMLHVFHGMGVYDFFPNILGYVQICQPIMVYFLRKSF